MIFEIENHENSFHNDLHIKKFNSSKLNFLIEYQYKYHPKMKTTDMNCTPIQLKMPMDMERMIEINDAVYMFNEVVAHIDLNRYFAEKGCKTGRPRYDREKLLKVVLFAFMERGYPSLRGIEKMCKTDSLAYLSTFLGYSHAIALIIHRL